MATITDPEASNILDQLTRVQVQLANKAPASDVSADALTIRTKFDDASNRITALTNRALNSNATLLDLEARVRVLEIA